MMAGSSFHQKNQMVASKGESQQQDPRWTFPQIDTRINQVTSGGTGEKWLLDGQGKQQSSTSLNKTQWEEKRIKEMRPVTKLSKKNYFESGMSEMAKRDLTSELLPDIVTKPSAVRVREGDKARLRCEVVNLGKYVLMWKQGKRVMTAGYLKVGQKYSYYILIEK